MKCLNCNYDFCWLCLKACYMDHYAVYSILDCPGMESGKNKTFIKIYILDNSPGLYVRQFCLLRILYAIFVIFITGVIILLIIAFFLLFGCPFEFVKCYLNKKPDEDSDDDIVSYSNENKTKINTDEDEDKPLNWKDYILIFLLVILGICLQPLYILFYIMKGMSEMYQRCGCMFLFAMSSGG